MKYLLVLVLASSFAILQAGCKSCDCDCQGDLNIKNTSSTDYSFEIRKKAEVIFRGTIMGYDDVWFGLEEGSFKLLYGEQNPGLEKSFSITDCGTTTLVIGD